ncbi:MAG: hypothetical protein MUP85_14720 [Candidatus Lokiarchaeota archaeon]|nr:hypothetical protein [Candidatus Lokiarchaeota archaeon]
MASYLHTVLAITGIAVQERTVQADNFTTEVLTELMKQVPDVLSRIIAEKGGIERINKISNDN